MSFRCVCANGRFPKSAHLDANEVSHFVICVNDRRNTLFHFNLSGLHMKKNISLRVGLVIIFILVGFVFPLSFGLAALIAFSVYDDISKPRTDGASGHSKLTDLTSETEGWQDSFRAVCESPAETGFLDAMICAFDLEPENGFLSGGGLKLSMQVPVARYRLDFLVDDRLVVEVDGAAYHSSPEAIESDQRRDLFLNEKGFEVLRIPAKTTLYSAHEAVVLVKNARVNVKRQDHENERAVKESFRPTRIASALKSAVLGASDGIGKATDYIHREAEKSKETDRLEVERRTKEQLQAIQIELEGNAERKKLFEKTRKLFD